MAAGYLLSFPWKRESTLFHVLLDTRFRGYDIIIAKEEFFNYVIILSLLTGKPFTLLSMFPYFNRGYALVLLLLLKYK